MERREPDPNEEMFEVLDAQGEPTGEIRSRAEVHRRGLWHRSFHCWLIWRDRDGQPTILFQRRSMNKDTAGGLLDVAVGGHYRAGERPDEVYREVDEELGISVNSVDLQFIGVRFASGVGPGYVDCEVQDVHVYILKEDIMNARPAFEEITALETVRFHDLERAFDGAGEPVPCLRFPVTPENRLRAPTPATLTRHDFVTVHDGYWLAGARAAVSVLDGAPDVALCLSNVR